jgi:hypothetical protein
VRSAIFWDISQGITVVHYRRFGPTYLSHLQWSNSLSSHHLHRHPYFLYRVFRQRSGLPSSNLPIWWRHNTSFGWPFTLWGQLISQVGQSSPHISGLDRAGYPPNSTTYTANLTPFNDCFDYGRRCFRKGYQSDGGTGKVIVSYSRIVSGLVKLAILPPPSPLSPSKGVSSTIGGAFVKLTNLMAAQYLLWLTLYSLLSTINLTSWTIIASYLGIRYSWLPS